MKLHKVIFAGFIACAFAATASAQTVIRITGSTAYRGATHTAITKILNAGFTYGYTGGTLSGASQAIFTGTANVAGNPAVIIKTGWSGSVGGVQTVSKNLNVNFLPNSTTQSTGGTSGATAGTEAGIPDVAMSDTFQSSTDFITPVLRDTVVGVVPFKWVANAGAPAGLNNVTPQLAQALWSSGQIPLSLFSGLTADATITVNAIGRDPDSGTRLTAFAESGVGVSSIVTQFQPTVSGGAVTSQQPWPASTINGIPVAVGNGGYASGGTLAGVMGNTSLAGIGGYYITYLSTGDATTAINAGGKELAYNGVTYSLTALQEGLYTFWGYEHLMYRNSYTGTGKTVADKLATQLRTVDATVLTGTMKVNRATDGGLITPL